MNDGSMSYSGSGFQLELTAGFETEASAGGPQLFFQADATVPFYENSSDQGFGTGPSNTAYAASITFSVGMLFGR